MANRGTVMASGPHALWVDRVSRYWGWVLALGIAFAILGAVGLTMLFSVTIASVFAFGVLAIGGAIAHVIQMFRMSRWRDSILQALIALLYGAVAGFVFVDPVAAAISLTLVLTVGLVSIGILRIIAGFDAKPLPGWGWLLANGIIDLLLGLMLLADWPATGLWLIGLVISVDLLVSGLAYVGASLQLNRHNKALRHQS